VSCRVDGGELLEAALKRGGSCSDSCDLSLDSDSEEDLHSPAENVGTGHGRAEGGDGTSTEDRNHHIVGNSDLPLDSVPDEAPKPGAIAAGSGAGNLQKAGISADKDHNFPNATDMPISSQEQAPECSRVFPHEESSGLCDVRMPKAESLKQLKRKLSEVDAERMSSEAGVADGAMEEPLEFRHIISQEEFERIRRLKVCAVRADCCSPVHRLAIIASCLVPHTALIWQGHVQCLLRSGKADLYWRCGQQRSHAQRSSCCRHGSDS
jgi:hypothetical protein